MQNLIAELKKLGKTVVENHASYIIVDGAQVWCSKDSRGKYRVDDKQYSSAKNAAYYIVTESLPAAKQRQELEELVYDVLNAYVGAGGKSIVITGTMEQVVAACWAIANVAEAIREV